MWCGLSLSQIDCLCYYLLDYFIDPDNDMALLVSTDSKKRKKKDMAYLVFDAT